MDLTDELTVTELLAPLADIDDRGRLFRGLIHQLARSSAARRRDRRGVRARLDPGRPPHVGVLLENTPFFSAMLAAAGMSGIVPVGLNPVRRGAAMVPRHQQG